MRPFAEIAPSRLLVNFRAFSVDIISMLNDLTHATKGQRVARRPHSYSVHGNTVLQSPQHPAPKRPALAVYGQSVPRAAAFVQNPVKRPAPPAAAPFEESKSAAAPSAERPDVPVARAIPAHTPPGVQAEARPEVPPRAAQKRRYGSLLSKIAFAALAALALAFLAYNALLWQNGVYLVQPPEDTALRGRMMDYAGGGASALEAPSAEDLSAQAFSPSVPFSWQYYTVRKGDSVSKIASAHALSMDAVIASNKVNNARNLREGDVLRIPNMDGIPYTIAANDSYEKIAEKFGVPLDAILDANDVQSGEMTAGEQIFIPGARLPAEVLKKALGEMFIYPVSGRISSPFGWRRDPFNGTRSFHKGIDIVADTGAPVKAAMAGRVALVGFSPVLGKYVVVSHNDGYQTMYAHLNAARTTRGAAVSQGDVIGEVGNTGYSTGPHLHFVIYKNGREVNPLEQLKL
jgi:murein DD-endopeptidase MepM/ murein hydrolase activator NlpD